MKKSQTNKRYAADIAAPEGQINEHRCQGVLSRHNMVFAFAGLASLALAGGCCTKSKTTASYTPLPATAYVEPAPQPVAQPAPAELGTVVPLYTESVNVQKREVDAGSVRIKKIIRTETVNQPVELRHEEIVIERGPGTGASKPIAEAFKEGETVVPLRREEAVIEKQTAPAGEIVVRSRWATEQSTVKTEIRREDIDLAGLSSTPHVIIGQNLTAAGAASTPGGQSTGAATSSGQFEIITDPGMLSDDSATKYGGRRVQFKQMKVHKVYGDRLYVVQQSDSGRPLYVVTSEPGSAFKEGDSVVITGKIHQGGKTVTQKDWDEKGGQLLMQQPYYIEVQKIEPAQ